MTINTILFDLDGTLVDTIGALLSTTNQLLEQGGRAALSRSDIRSKVSSGSLEMLRLGYPDISEEQLLAKQQTFFQVYAGQMRQQKSDLFDGIAELLKRIETHNYTWGIVTNKIESLTHQLIAQLNLNPAVVVGGDTLAVKKPHPEPLIYACKQLNIGVDQAIFIGDDRKDIQAATAANMRSVAVTYGYGDNVAAWQADCIIHHPSELWNCDGLA